jgi:CBS domain-containing protein
VAGLERSAENAVVVVDAAGRLQGVIERRVLDDGMLDPRIALVVVAADLAVPVRGVKPTDPLSTILARMLEANTHVIPVVDASERVLWLLTEHEATSAYYGLVAGHRLTRASG